jgi:hypothetical protein
MIPQDDPVVICWKLADCTTNKIRQRSLLGHVGLLSLWYAPCVSEESVLHDKLLAITEVR